MGLVTSNKFNYRNNMDNFDSDSSAIENKKIENGETEDPNEKAGKRSLKFIKSLANILLFLVAYFSISMIVVFAGKLAQSNILPTDSSKAPYTSVPSVPPPQIPINIFVNGPKSNKISFSLESLKYKLIELTGKLKNVGSSSVLYFMGTVFEDFIAFNYSALNVGYNTINELLPEPAIFLFGPIINTILLGIIFSIDFVYIWLKWIMSLGKLFKENVNTSKTGQPNWQTKPFGLGFLVSICLAVFFFFTSWVSLAIPFILCPIIIISLIGYTGIMDGEKVAIGDILKRGLAHYKSIIGIVFSIFALSAAFSAFGGVGVGVGLGVIALIYFNKILTSVSVDDPDKVVGFFESFPQKNLSTISNYKQASIATSGGGSVNVNSGGSGGKKGISISQKKYKKLHQLYNKS
jgi:hypothetical protein